MDYYGEKAGGSIASRVKTMVDEIKKGGEEVVKRYSAKFDNYTGPVKITREELKKSVHLVDADIKKNLDVAYARIKRFAEAQRATMKDLSFEISPGYFVGHKVLPLDTVGCYVPGGRYSHLASALMTVTTAKAAGVKTVVACTPPKTGGLSPDLMYAMYIAGADYVLQVGGVQALASMAFGLFTGKPAVMLCGPGNRWVLEAKRLLYGLVGIDMIAGPTEICVIADSSADAQVVATDIVSQAEHGPDSPCQLVTTDPKLAAQVLKLVPELIALLPAKSKKAATTSWRDYGEIFVVDTREEMCAEADHIATEHLEVHCRNLPWYHQRLKNYGSLFLGEETCVSYGDKSSGPNHVLPTQKAARYTGGLYVGMFVKTCSFQQCTREGGKTVAVATASIARAEGMEGHARSADIRLQKYGFPSKL